MKRKTYSYLRGRTQRVGAKFEARPTEYVRPEAVVEAPLPPVVEEAPPAPESDESGDDSEKE